MNNKRNMQDIPYRFSNVDDPILNYDYILHKWTYDAKYYLNGNDWCCTPDGNITVRRITEKELKRIERYKGVIEECERENTAWTNHKQCRKRSCICKKCEKYCHCYECMNKINACDKLEE